MKKKNNSLEKIKSDILNLIEKINYYDDLYYNKNYQEINDQEYDSLREQLLVLEKNYPELRLSKSPNLRVGAPIKEIEKSISHTSPMLSLNNAYDEKDVMKFYERLQKIVKDDFDIIAETKVDGLSASLRYEKSKLKVAITRGDGIKGEDITKNIMHVAGVKKELPTSFPSKLEIRGEIYMPKKIFNVLNNERKKNGETLFSTTRNAAAGSIRQLDPEITRKRKLSFFGYTVVADDSNFFETIIDIRKKLKENYFALNEPSHLCKNVNEMIDFYNKISKIRAELDYDIDGIVYKLNSLRHHNLLGNTIRFPRWALAHKFPAENVFTKLLDVKFQVGRTGSITPVAILKEVKIGGVSVSRATLHNEDEIQRLGLCKGDTIVLKRAGDVIPKIISVVKKNRSTDVEPIKMPIYCPSCNKKLYRLGSEVLSRCLNYFFCEEQVINRLSHFVSRDAFDIAGLAKSQLKMLWEKGFIKEFRDIFLLSSRADDIAKFDGWGKKSASNLLYAIKKSQNIAFDKFIYSLGIRHVGQGVSKLITKEFNNLEDLINYYKSSKEKKNINKKVFEGIGDTIANSISDYFSNKENLEIIFNLMQHISINYTLKKQAGALLKTNIVITGTFQSYSRKIIENKLIDKGANVLKTVTNKTDLVIVGEEPGKKLHEAKNKNIKIIGEKDLLKIIN